jgi:hypothetical protein
MYKRIWRIPLTPLVACSVKLLMVFFLNANIIAKQGFFMCPATRRRRRVSELEMFIIS